MRELKEKKQHAVRDLREHVWRAYRRVVLVSEGLKLQEVDLGLLHSSAAESLLSLILARLKQEGLLEESISPDFLVRNWPPALTEWTTKAVRDMFFASPEFPRLLEPEILRKTIADGVKTGKFGYANKDAKGVLGQPEIENPSFGREIVEFSDEVVLLPRDVALEFRPDHPPEKVSTEVTGTTTGPETPVTKKRVSQLNTVQPYRGLSWEGQLPPQQWTNFYMKVLTHFANDRSLHLHVRLEVSPEGGISQTRVKEIEGALRDLGLDNRAIRTEPSERPPEDKNQ